MSYLFSSLEPQPVLRNFYELSQAVSRRADHTQGISDWLSAFGRRHGLAVYQDETTNVILKKPCTPGYENAPTVMLAAHMDMICACAPGVTHDFDTEPLQLLLEGDIIRANGTTLGADCGIGMACILAVLEAGDIPHPALEAVFTTNEETDMKGAMQLNYEQLTSKCILSLDATRLSLGGAGELEAALQLPRTSEPFAEGCLAAELSVGGLVGGHSGKNACAERGNANTLLTRVLEYLRQEKNVPLRIARFDGGAVTACALAREARCVIEFPAECLPLLRREAEEWQRRYQTELEVPDPHVRLGFELLETPPETVCSGEDTDRFLTLMTVLPDGLCTLHKYFEHKYESCCNVGVVETKADAFQITLCIRSAVQAKKYYLFDKIKRICSLTGAQCAVLHDLPQWEYNNGSRLAQVIAPVYDDLAPNVAQGTCEQGIFLAHMPGAEAAGVGPVVHNPHSPNEFIRISEVKADYERFLQALALMKNY